jgi:hypothetical protein
VQLGVGHDEPALYDEGLENNDQLPELVCIFGLYFGRHQLNLLNERFPQLLILPFSVSS